MCIGCIRIPALYDKLTWSIVESSYWDSNFWEKPTLKLRLRKARKVLLAGVLYSVMNIFSLSSFGTSNLACLWRWDWALQSRRLRFIFNIGLCAPAEVRDRESEREKQNKIRKICWYLEMISCSYCPTCYLPYYPVTDMNYFILSNYAITTISSSMKRFSTVLRRRQKKMYANLVSDW